MKKEGWDFKEALAHLAEKAGVPLIQPSSSDLIHQEADKRLKDLLSAAADYYNQLLLYAPQAEQARNYIQERGLEKDTVTAFLLGYALNSWDAMRSHFTMQGYSEDDLVNTGLLTVNEEKATRYDRFRNRIMIPIRDLGGRVIGFGARTLDPEGLPKYINSPQTTVFDKGRTLFGLDLNKRSIREAKQVVIVEGYMDVMQAWQAGYRNVVAQMGTSLTVQQLRLAKRFSKRFIIALDADAAGTQATLRSLNVARDALDRESEIRFDARGLVKYESHLRADIRVVTLPEGKDPDNIIRQDPEKWPSLIDSAKPVVTYVIDIVTGNLDKTDPKAKTAAVKQVMPLINDVADAPEREHYLQLLARRLGIDLRALHTMPTTRTRPRSPSASSGSDESTRDHSARDPQAVGFAAALTGQVFATDVRESNFLGYCWKKPLIIDKVNRKLLGCDQAPIAAEDFTRSDDRALWNFLRSHSSRWSVVTVNDLWDSLEDEVLRQRAGILLELPELLDSGIDRFTERLVLSILDWRLQKVRGLINEVEALFREAEAEDREELMTLYGKQLRELMKRFFAINRARATISAVGRRNAEAFDQRRP
jgi:DNA primase